jgi:hypothetical protein
MLDHGMASPGGTVATRRSPTVELHFFHSAREGQPSSLGRHRQEDAVTAPAPDSSNNATPKSSTLESFMVILIDSAVASPQNRIYRTARQERGSGPSRPSDIYIRSNCPLTKRMRSDLPLPELLLFEIKGSPAFHVLLARRREDDAGRERLAVDKVGWLHVAKALEQRSGACRSWRQDTL